MYNFGSLCLERMMDVLFIGRREVNIMYSRKNVYLAHILNIIYSSASTLHSAPYFRDNLPQCVQKIASTTSFF